MKYSETVTEGFLRPEEANIDLAAFDETLAVERVWYRDSPLRLQTNEEILRAAEFGLLERVDPDENIGMAMRFLNPDLVDVYPPFLTGYAAEALSELGNQWRVVADLLDVDPRARLSLTSLVRSQKYQNYLVRKGKPAVPNSTHMCGGTFDLDLTGYRIVNYRAGHDAVVSMRTPESQKVIASAFAEDFGARDPEPIRLGPEHYDPNVPEALLIAAGLFYRIGRINMVSEGVGTKNSALHVAVAPPWVS